MTKEIKSKYEKCIANIEWHVRVNKPEGKELESCNIKLDCYREILKDLSHDQFTPSNVAEALAEYVGLNGFNKQSREYITKAFIAGASLSYLVCGKWVKASERLPEVIEVPYANWQGMAWDKGSDRVYFKYKGEPLVGRYILEKGAFKNIFVSSEMDRVILSSEFEHIIWLDESSPCLCARYKEALEKIRGVSNEGVYVVAAFNQMRQIVTEALK